MFWQSVILFILIKYYDLSTYLCMFLCICPVIHFKISSEFSWSFLNHLNHYFIKTIQDSYKTPLPTTYQNILKEIWKTKYIYKSWRGSNYLQTNKHKQPSTISTQNNSDNISTKTQLIKHIFVPFTLTTKLQICWMNE